MLFEHAREFDVAVRGHRTNDDRVTFETNAVKVRDFGNINQGARGGQTELHGWDQ